MDKLLENNNVELVGEIVSDFRFSHEVYGERFYLVDVAVKRMSETIDYLPLLISEYLIDVNTNHIGEIIHVTGQFRSYNRHEELKNRLVLSVFVLEIEFIEEETEEMKSNQIILDGYICKDPIYRKTPLGREIADLLVAVNRSYSKSDYIPCICWSRNARHASGLPLGTHLKITGRIQSRDYIKHHSNGEEEERRAYEISASRIEVISDEK
jgi:single-stranded DNA-binding protein|nr:MAG TPA: Single strand binding protein [Bacteriophage sp.]